ncbi:STAS domain-containing protein [candidate division KSB1 bacterium]|nr:STAS domain-containing protein [candidate division KSB1 bacterium]
MNYQTIEIDHKNDELFIKILESRIYLGVTDLFADEMAHISTLDFKNMTVDMKKVSVMNSSGIGVLIKTRDELLKQGKSIRLIHMQPLMTDIFNRMRLDTLFKISSE